MNILIYLKHVESLEYLLKIIEMMDLDVVLHEASNEDELLDLYTKDKYDILFLEYSKNIWNSIIQKILHTNTSQNVILLSEEYHCSLNNDCSYCQKNYNVNVLIKPILDINTSHLFSKVISCEEYEKSELQFNLMQLVKKLNVEYVSIDVDLTSYIVTYGALKGYRKVLAIADLVRELNIINLHYEVLPNLDVQILYKEDKSIKGNK